MACLALVGGMVLGACGDEDDAGGEDLAATCELMDTIEGPDDVTVEKLDELLEVAPDRIEDDVRLVRDRLDAVGEDAYEEEEVGAAFERVGSFEEAEC